MLLLVSFPTIMSMIDFGTVESICFAVQDKPTRQERAAYMGDACGTAVGTKMCVLPRLQFQTLCLRCGMKPEIIMNMPKKNPKRYAPTE
jgi:hypothetical protein